MLRISNHLQERSFLVWDFYSLDGVELTKTCEFMENVTIKESSRSRMGAHSPIGRNGSVYVHMGSDSREFSLQFNMTLPNIIEHTTIKKEGGGLFSFDFLGALDRGINKSAKILEYTEGVEEGIQQNTRPRTLKELVRESDKIFQGYLDDQEVYFQTFKVFNEGAKDLTSFAGDTSNLRTEAIAKVLFWLNLIRVSTMTHASKPWLGPPILRLTHGLVYQNLPCIAKSWNVEIDGAAGYDNRTLLPRVIKVSMNLCEVRLNNEKFDQFEGNEGGPEGLIGWDTLAGSDSFISFNKVNVYEAEEEEEP